MPTGYTAGLLDGKISTFQEFATQCMRAFGALIHMRDEKWDAPITMPEPSKYHQEKIHAAEKLVNDANTLHDEVLLYLKRGEIQKSIEYHRAEILKISNSSLVFVNVKADTMSWVPPTPDHKELKDFMLEQLDMTMQHDLNPSYHEEKLVELERKIKTLDAQSIREEMLEEAKKDLAYHSGELNKQSARIESAKQWITDALGSLAGTPQETE